MASSLRRRPLPPPPRDIGRRSVLATALAAVFGAFGAFVTAAQAQPAPGLFIVVNAKNPASSVPRQFLADAFLKKVTRWSHDVTIRPADQLSSSEVRKLFSSTVLKRSVAAMRHYWQQRIFSGRDLPPPELASDAEVQQYVARHEGGVGYLASQPTHEGVKVLAVR